MTNYYLVGPDNGRITEKESSELPIIDLTKKKNSEKKKKFLLFSKQRQEEKINTILQWLTVRQINCFNTKNDRRIKNLKIPWTILDHQYTSCKKKRKSDMKEIVHYMRLLLTFISPTASENSVSFHDLFHNNYFIFLVLTLLFKNLLDTF